MRMPSEALIVIDVQPDFCPGGALAVPGGDAVIAPINAKMDDFAAVVLTQDWHPADHLSFASQHPGKAPYDLTEMPYGPQVLWPDHCVIGTPGAALHPDLRQDAAQLILRKGFRRGIDSYSAFFENDGSTVTGLAGWLRERDIEHVVLCGLALDFCVAYSALDALRLGFRVTVDLPACRGIDLDGSIAQALEKMRAAGVVLEG